MNDLTQWLHSLGLEEHAPAFVAQGIDFDLLPQLGDADLKETRRRAARPPQAAADGDRRAGRSWRGARRAGARGRAQRAARCRAAPAHGDVLRPRRLDATRRPARPGGPAARDPRLPRGVAAAVAPYDGHVAQLLGDGCLVYFGYPQRARGRRRARRACGAERAAGGCGVQAAGRASSCRRASASPPAWSWSARSAPALRRSSRRPAARRRTSRRACRRRRRRARSCCRPRRAAWSVRRSSSSRPASSNSRASPRPSRRGACAASAAWRAASRRSTRAS